MTFLTVSISVTPWLLTTIILSTSCSVSRLERKLNCLAITTNTRLEGLCAKEHRVPQAPPMNTTRATEENAPTGNLELDHARWRYEYAERRGIIHAHVCIVSHAPSCMGARHRRVLESHER